MQFYELRVIRGDSGHWQFKLWQDNSRTIPFDVTGSTAAAEIREASGADPAIEMPCTITGHAIDMVLSAADSRTLPDRAQWDLELRNGAGVQTIIGGPVSVTADITNSEVAA